MEQSQPNPYQAPESDVVKTSVGGYNDSGIFTFNGRIGRLRYLAYTMLSYLLALVCALIITILISIFFAVIGMVGETAGVIAVVFAYIPMLFVGIMLMKRRLNDCDRSGWWMLLSLIPGINFVFGLYLVFHPGTEGENNYGLPARPNTTRVKIAAFSFILVPIIGILAAIAIPAYQDYVNRSGSASITQQP